MVDSASRVVAVAVLCAGLGAWSEMAGAATSCADALPAVDPRVFTLHDAGGAAPTGSVACELADSIANDDDSAVNDVEGFFGAPDAGRWTFRERVTFLEQGTGTAFVEDDGAGGIGFLAGVAFPDPNTGPTIGSGEGGRSEIWHVDPAALAPGEEIMILFKGGTKVLPAPVIAYLIGPGIVSGSYGSPFANANNGAIVAISHASVYTRLGGSVTAIPLPGGLALMLGALAGLGLAGRRRAPGAGLSVRRATGRAIASRAMRGAMLYNLGIGYVRGCP